jgi:hypothetical protein
VRNGTFTPVVASNLVSATENDATIERLGWRDLLDGARSSGEGAHLQSEAPHGLSAWLPKNVVKRFSDWSYFAVRIFEGPMTVLFGHPRPVDRSILTSAHNYYLDFAYNFGVIALMPLGALVVYTAQLLFRRRRQLLSDPGLIALVGVVIFLVAIDSSFKVTLRQPYPGIFAFFAWGLLLSRLRHLGQRARRL